MAEQPLESYVFMSDLDVGTNPRQVKEAFATRRGVRFVAEFVGSFKIFGAVETATLEDLQNLIAGEYWETGLRSDWSTLVKASELMTPKRGSPDYCAIVRAQPTDDAIEVLGRLDDRFRERFEADPAHGHFVYGAAVVTGSWDLLIDLGADSRSEVMGLVLDDVRQVSGIGRTQTSLAYLPGNAIRPTTPGA
jgi:hypothetical protein